MVTVTPLLRPKEAALEAPRLEALASRWCVPYAVPVDEHTLKTYEGNYLQVIRLGGFTFDTADRSELDVRKHIRNHLWRTLSRSDLAVYHHVIRRACKVEPEGSLPEGFARDLDAAWKAQLSRRRLYRNDIYLTVLHKQGEGTVRRASGLLAGLSQRMNDAERQRYEERALAELGDTVRGIMESFRAYRPELLGVQPDADGVPLSEMLRHFGFLLNLTDRKFALPARPVSEVLPIARTVFRHELLELWHADHTLHAGMLSVKEYPAASITTMYDRLLSLPLEFCMTQSFRFEERVLTASEIDRQRRRLINTNDKGFSQVQALSRAMDENMGDAGFGLHHQTFMAWDPEPSEVSRKLATIDAVMGELGIACVRENVNLQAAFYAQLPGNFRFITRGARVSTKNFASFASGHNFAQGAPRAHWGAAVTVLPTSSSTAHFFNFHVADRGNTLVLGPTGQGKTLTLAFLFCQSLRLGGRRVFLDKDRGMEIFVRALGGRYFRIESHRPTGWNPLQMPDTPRLRGFLMDWFEAMLAGPASEPIGVDDRQRIRQAVTSAFDLPPHLRVLRHIAPLFGNAEQDQMARRLLDWYHHPKFGEGRYAWMFDNETNSIDLDGRVLGFDMTQVLDMTQARAPAVLWLFYLVEGLADGQPLAIFADEGWRLLDDELIARRLEDIEFVIRKKNGMLTFATQAPETVMRSRIAPALKQQSETFILFPNPKADEEVYRGYLDLNETQFDLIKRRLPELGQPGWFLVRNGRGASVCHLDMRGMDDFIAVLSGNKNTVELADRLIARHGERPGDWLPHFYREWRSARAGLLD